jgi:peptide-methionine (S)-S-oxide reductase
MGNTATAESGSSSNAPMAIPAKHIVLGTPLNPTDNPKLHSAVFATGCFWGSEKAFWRMPGVYTTAVGYIAGSATNPSYDQVCSGRSGHAEAVQVFWDPERLAFADLMREFLESHDPTQGNGQGNDRGTQYRSGVYARSEEDYQVAKAAIAAYQKALGRKVTSEVVFPAPDFYFAEKYHQQYLAIPGNRKYCSAEPTGVRLPPAETWLPAGATPPKLSQKYWDEHAPTPGCVLKQPDEQIKWA